MRKREELNNVESCLSKAKWDEIIFILLERDVAAPIAITQWIEARIRLGKNTPDDEQIREAEYCVATMLGDPSKTRAEMPAAPAPPNMEGLPDEYPNGVDWLRNEGREVVLLIEREQQNGVQGRQWEKMDELLARAKSVIESLVKKL